MLETEIGGTRTHQAQVLAMGTAGTDVTQSVWRVPRNATVQSVKFVPDAAITADGTNNSILTLTNKGTGAGSTAVASRSWAATNSSAATEETFTLNATAANLAVTAGDNVALVKTHGGTGLILPSGRVFITYIAR